jgi:hypothetical protein
VLNFFQLLNVAVLSFLPPIVTPSPDDQEKYCLPAFICLLDNRGHACLLGLSVKHGCSFKKCVTQPTNYRKEILNQTYGEL